MPESKKVARRRQKCPFCDQNGYYHEIRIVKFTYREHSTEVRQPGYWCDSCGEGCIEGNDLKATREELKVFRTYIDNKLALDGINNCNKNM